MKIRVSTQNDRAVLRDAWLEAQKNPSLTVSTPEGTSFTVEGPQEIIKAMCNELQKQFMITQIDPPLPPIDFENGDENSW